MPAALGIDYSFLLGTGETASGVLGSLLSPSDGQTGVSPAEDGQSTCHSGRLLGLCFPQSEEEKVKGGPDRCFWLAAGGYMGGGGSRLFLCICPGKMKDIRNKLPQMGGNFN